eukprot:Nk52_evm35s1360 gene=Nk52_evmTU35s1360
MNEVLARSGLAGEPGEMSCDGSSGSIHDECTNTATPTGEELERHAVELSKSILQKAIEEFSRAQAWDDYLLYNAGTNIKRSRRASEGGEKVRNRTPTNEFNRRKSMSVSPVEENRRNMSSKSEDMNRVMSEGKEKVSFVGGSHVSSAGRKSISLASGSKAPSRLGSSKSPKSGSISSENSVNELQSALGMRPISIGTQKRSPSSSSQGFLPPIRQTKSRALISPNKSIPINATGASSEIGSVFNSRVPTRASMSTFSSEEENSELYDEFIPYPETRKEYSSTNQRSFSFYDANSHSPNEESVNSMLEFFKSLDQWIRGPFECEQSYERVYENIHLNHQELENNRTHYEDIFQRIAKRRRSSTTAPVINRRGSAQPADMGSAYSMKGLYSSQGQSAFAIHSGDAPADSQRSPVSPSHLTSHCPKSIHFGHHIDYENKERNKFDDWMASKHPIDVSHNAYYNPYHTHEHHFNVHKTRTMNEEMIRQIMMQEHRQMVDASLANSFAAQLYKAYLLRSQMKPPNYLKNVEPLANAEVYLGLIETDED